MNNKIDLIAEIGWNHMGDMDLALNMIKLASKSGADICKFQTWSEKNLKNGSWDMDGRREIYKKAQLTINQHKYLIKKCNEENINFMSSVFSLKDLAFYKKLNLKYIKIPSHEVYNLELIKEAILSFEKIFISIGACTKIERNNIIQLAKKNQNKKIILMHCVSSYPCPAENVNFPKMLSMKKKFKNIGYSGHFSGINDALIAITLGAHAIEKHFTINRKLPGRDNKFALLPKDFQAISRYINDYAKMNINLGLGIQKIELDIHNNYRGRWSK